nr:unnamed protein product [Callosobruchus analis]
MELALFLACFCIIQPGLSQVNTKEFKIWGPGLEPDKIVMPARYFFVELTCTGPEEWSLTQKEFDSAVKEIMMDGINDQSDEIDAVYIPPEVDTLTDKEDVNDDMNPRESEEPFDVVGTFELYVPDNTELPDQSFTLSTDEPE